ncbi:MAG: hypothetical protein D3908_01150, partial [Candidatus Electrothrix sp. AUS4]|nr:hypothetical protein [Candidatus Electrothrix sp. AUS4]
APERNDIGQNIYLLELGKKGVKMKNTPGRAKKIVAENLSFPARTKVEENLQPIYMYATAPLQDFWVWEYLLAYGGEASTSHTVDSPYLSGEGTAVLTVNMVGMVNSSSGEEAPYKVTVFLNDVEVGTAEWSEHGDYQFRGEVSAEVLREGGNDVRLVSRLNSGVKYSLVYLDSFELEYLRSYDAENGELFFRSGTFNKITVNGFSSRQVLVLDITDPDNPSRLRTLPKKNETGEYSITVLTEPGHEYLATENISTSVSGEVTVDSPSQLHDRGNSSDYLIITSLNLLDSARRLEEYRAGQGLETMLVDIEDIRDEFSDSLAAPEVLHKFLSHVYHNWSKVPRYVVLVGDGSVDYKDYLGYGYPVVPTELVTTSAGFFPSDNGFADVDGDDGVPEYSLGRIPVVDSSELDSYIDKLVRYEQASSGGNAVLNLVTDRADSAAGNFSASADKLIGLVPGGLTVNRLDAGSLGNSGVHGRLVEALRQGGGILHYKGHSSLVALGRSSSLLSAADIEGMSEIGSPMLMVSMACSTASFGYPEMKSIGEAAVVRADGAAVGFLGATGLSTNYLADTLSEGFYLGLRDLANSGMGDAVAAAKRYYADRESDKDLLYIYNFLGDPAASLPAGTR